jgi:phenylalanyl-tRNA synthetase beta chain
MSANVLLDRESIGIMGRVHPSLYKDEIYVVELSLGKIMSKNVKAIKYKESSKYPAISKDMAFIVKKDVMAKDIMEVIKKACGRLLTDINVFDVYVGENVGNDEKSIAFNLTFQDPSRTLSDEEVMQLFNKAIESVTTKLNAVLRDK